MIFNKKSNKEQYYSIGDVYIHIYQQ